MVTGHVPVGQPRDLHPNKRRLAGRKSRAERIRAGALDDGLESFPVEAQRGSQAETAGSLSLARLPADKKLVWLRGDFG